jgi:hypothetical protein
VIVGVVNHEYGTVNCMIQVKTGDYVQFIIAPIPWAERADLGKACRLCFLFTTRERGSTVSAVQGRGHNALSFAASLGERQGGAGCRTEALAALIEIVKRSYISS